MPFPYSFFLNPFTHGGVRVFKDRKHLRMCGGDLHWARALVFSPSYGFRYLYCCSLAPIPVEKHSLACFVYTLGQVDRLGKPGPESMNWPCDLGCHWQASARMCAVGRVSRSSSKYNTVVWVSLLSRVFSLLNSELFEDRNHVLFIYLCIVLLPSSALSTK